MTNTFLSRLKEPCQTLAIAGHASVLSYVSKWHHLTQSEVLTVDIVTN